MLTTIETPSQIGKTRGNELKQRLNAAVATALVLSIAATTVPAGTVVAQEATSADVRMQLLQSVGEIHDIQAALGIEQKPVVTGASESIKTLAQPSAFTLRCEGVEGHPRTLG